jgi:hypothetical protein
MTTRSDDALEELYILAFAAAGNKEIRHYKEDGMCIVETTADQLISAVRRSIDSLKTRLAQAEAENAKLKAEAERREREAFEAGQEGELVESFDRLGQLDGWEFKPRYAMFEYYQRERAEPKE